MPRAIPVATREAIVARHQAGVSLPRVVAELALPWATVRRIWRRYRDRGGTGLAPDYAAGGRRGPRHPPVLYDRALAVRREHPGWGAGLIRVEVGKQFPDHALPHERTLRRWFAAAGLAPPPRPFGEQIVTTSRRADNFDHQVWRSFWSAPRDAALPAGEQKEDVRLHRVGLWEEDVERSGTQNPARGRNQWEQQRDEIHDRGRVIPTRGGHLVEFSLDDLVAPTILW